MKFLAVVLAIWSAAAAQQLPARQTTQSPPQLETGCQELGEALAADRERNTGYSLAEYNAYVAVNGETDQQLKIQKWREFVSQFPHSSLLSFGQKFYLTACSDSGNSRGEQAEPEPNEARRYAMFAGNVWPGNEGLARIAQSCGAPTYASFDQNSFNDIESIAQDLESVRKSWGMAQRVIIVPLGSPIVNSWTLNSSTGGIGRNLAIICLPFGIQNIFGADRSELEALIAHEMGHAIDTECYNYAKRSLAGKRSCEARADAYAFAALVELHRDPYAMAGMFGRLEMFYGDVGTGILDRLANALGANHPITPDRITSVKNLLVQYQNTRQTSLPQAVP